MKKREFIKLLEEELKRLEEVEHISDLANNGRYKEVDVVLGEIDYSILEEYMDSEEFEPLEMSDISKQYVVTFAIYLSGSNYDECDVMDEDWSDLCDALEETNDVGKAIAEYVISNCINTCGTFAELMGEKEEEKWDEVEKGEEPPTE